MNVSCQQVNSNWLCWLLTLNLLESTTILEQFMFPLINAYINLVGITCYIQNKQSEIVNLKLYKILQKYSHFFGHRLDTTSLLPITDYWRKSCTINRLKTCISFNSILMSNSWTFKTTNAGKYSVQCKC